MIDKINRFLARVVSVNYYVYIVVGMLFGLALPFLMAINYLNYYQFWGIPVLAYSLIARIFCAHFYQEQYDEFPFQKVDHNMHIGIPMIDNIFYSVISDGLVDAPRKYSGYIYAASRPIIMLNIGVNLAFLIFVANVAIIK